MRKKTYLFIMSLMLVFIFSACNNESKNSSDLKKMLNDKLSTLNSYKMSGNMTLKIGAVPQVYAVEVWYKSPEFYRVNLQNENKENNQIIIKNKEGVFVLTPALNKSFKFQSEWPDNGGQAYLYHSLVKDVLSDKKTLFKATKKEYVFSTKTRYINNTLLSRQDISFDKKHLAPKKVAIFDQDNNEIISMNFTKTDFGVKLKTNDFDVKKNMTTSSIKDTTLQPSGTTDNFKIHYPASQIDDIVLVGEKSIEGYQRINHVLTFKGVNRGFSIIESKAEVEKTVLSANQIGEPANLGFTIGTITDTSLSWTFDGVDFLLASKDLSKNEMIEIACSLKPTQEK